MDLYKFDFIIFYMIKLIGLIQYRVFAEGTKSESKRPFICFENGTQIRLYKQDDNPFENKGFLPYENKTVKVEGNLINGVFEVVSIEEYQEKEKTSDEEE